MTTIQERRDTAAQWTTVNPTLAAGEHGLETDTRLEKIGDGVTAWTALPYTTSALVAKTSLSLNVKDYGATGDGATNDRAAIQSALSAAAGGAAVYFPKGTYIVDLAASADYMLTVTAGVTLYSHGGAATIKVKTSAGNYRALLCAATPGADLSGVVLDGLTFDMNNTGNAATSTTPMFAGYPRYTFYAGVGSGITVRNCVVKDVDSVNTLSIAGAAVSDVTVRNCKFKAVGTSVAAHDHSTIYISASGISVTGNLFEGVAGGLGATTAIETHGSNQIVANNRVRDFYNGANITGVTANGSDNAVVEGNTIRDAMIGLALWSYTTTGSTGLRNCTVANNTITLTRDNWLRGTSDYPRGILFDPTATQHYENIKVTGNTIVFNAFSAAALASELNGAGISVSLNNAAIEIRNLDIIDNTIVGALSSGIRLAATLKRSRVARNRIVDPGSSTEAAMASFYKSGITVVGTLTDVTIEGNTTFDTRATHVLAQGIQTSLVAAIRCVTRRNPVACTDGASLPPFVATSGTGKAFLYEEAIETYAVPTYAVRAGSTLLVNSTGVTYRQTAAPDGATWSAVP